jgi:hypothetical protein
MSEANVEIVTKYFTTISRNAETHWNQPPSDAADRAVRIPRPSPVSWLLKKSSGVYRG